MSRWTFQRKNRGVPFHRVHSCRPSATRPRPRPLAPPGERQGTSGTTPLSARWLSRFTSLSRLCSDTAFTHQQARGKETIARSACGVGTRGGSHAAHRRRRPGFGCRTCPSDPSMRESTRELNSSSQARSTWILQRGAPNRVDIAVNKLHPSKHTS
jgi:hypothetical protein